MRDAKGAVAYTNEPFFLWLAPTVAKRMFYRQT